MNNLVWGNDDGLFGDGSGRDLSPPQGLTEAQWQAICQKIDHRDYAITAAARPGTYHAMNRAQGCGPEFDATGFSAILRRDVSPVVYP